MFFFDAKTVEFFPEARRVELEGSFIFLGYFAKGSLSTGADALHV